MHHQEHWTMKLALLCITAVFGIGLPASAATFAVTTTADGNDGACDNHCSLREAIVAANSDPDRDIIDLPAGIYLLSIPGRNEDHAATGDLDILERVEIRGASERTTVIDGGGVDRVLHIHIMDWHEDDEPVEVFDVTITGGDIRSETEGAGVLNHGALVLKRCTIEGNSATGFGADGGGVANSGALVLASVTITNNSTSGEDGDGGGVWNRYGTMTLDDSRIVGNTTAGDGAGLWSEYGTVAISNTTVSGNTSVGVRADGGGLWIGFGALTLARSTVSGNSITSVTGGGGIWASSSTAVMINSTISGNVVKGTGRGGGLWTGDSTVTLTNCTFVGNSAGGGRGPGNAIRSRGGIATLVNNLVGGDCDTGIGVLSMGGNLESPGDSCGFSRHSDRTGVPAAALAIGDLADNGGSTLTHALLADSAAIDHGLQSGCPSRDQRGEPRPRDGDGDDEADCDIGAYEAGTKPTDGYSYSYWVPVAAHIDGANGSKWRTTVGTFNKSPSQAAIELILRTPDQSSAIAAVVAGSGQGMFHDVAAQLGIDNDKGTLEIRSDRPLIVTSRTFNQTAEGTFGQYLGGTTAEEGLRAGETGTLPQLTQSVAYRCNLGLANLGSGPATVEVALYDGGGSEVGSLSAALEPGQLHQENRIFENAAGRNEIDGGYAIISVTSGSGVVAYASVVDNGTGDATTIPLWR